HHCCSSSARSRACEWQLRLENIGAAGLQRDRESCKCAERDRASERDIRGDTCLARPLQPACVISCIGIGKRQHFRRNAIHSHVCIRTNKDTATTTPISQNDAAPSIEIGVCIWIQKKSG